MNKQEQGLTIAGKTYRSRLLVGSGKYRDLEQTREATEASGAEIITVHGNIQPAEIRRFAAQFTDPVAKPPGQRHPLLINTDQRVIRSRT